MVGHITTTSIHIEELGHLEVFLPLEVASLELALKDTSNALFEKSRPLKPFTACLIEGIKRGCYTH